MSRYRPGKKIGHWTLIEELGRGGNGVVWKASDKDGNEVAVKILLVQRKDSYLFKRFISEIELLRSLGPLPGILPILDSYLPDVPSYKDPSCFSMPIATPILHVLEKQTTLPVIIEAIASFAETLAELADRGISHRDIKPANLFQFEGKWVIGDFGIADYPEKEALTKPGQKLGPLHFMAPEMLENPDKADARRADVYSLSKTLWVLATGQNFPLPGELRLDVPALRLSKYNSDPSARYLDRLLEAATKHEPEQRVTMREMATELRSLLAPLVETDSIEDLSDITRRLTAVREPALRAEQVKSRHVQEAETLLAQLTQRLHPLQRALCKAGGVDSTPVYFKPLNNMLAYSQAIGEPDLLWSKGSWFVLETTKEFPVLYFCGLGVDILGNGVVRLAAGHLLHIKGLRDEWEWNEVVTARLGSSELENASTKIINGLTATLRDALTYYAEAVENTP